MKMIIQIIVLMMLFISTINAQNTDFIDIKKGKDLKEIRIHELSDNYVSYEEHGSLHDVINTNINFIIKGNKKYVFNGEGVLIDSLIVQKESSNTIIDYVISTTGIKGDVEHEQTTSTDNKEVIEIISDSIKDGNKNKTVEVKNSDKILSIELLKLKSMYDEGLINKEEFIILKNKVFENEEVKVPKNEEKTTDNNELGKSTFIEYPSLVKDKILYVRPLALLDGFSGSKLGAGIQLKISEKMYFKQFLGYVSRGKELFINPGTTFENGFETRSELKFIQSEKIMKMRHKQPYFSLDIGYKRMWDLNIKYNDDEYYSIGGNTAYHNTFNFKYGQQHFYKSGFFIDWYLGIGIKNIIHPNINYEYWYNEDLGDYYNDKMSNTNNGGEFYSYTYIGQKTIPNFTAGIDIGFKF